jgi:hypothetical protein
MRRIAKLTVFVTTPNFRRSRAGNHMHAREHTIAGFFNIMRPDELYVASPDGWAHRTRLLHRLDDGRIVHDQWVWNDYVPFIHRFNDTVDGECWPHMMGVWYCKAT